MTALEQFIGGSESGDPDLATTPRTAVPADGGADSIAAAVGPLETHDPIPDPVDINSSALLTMRENTELSLIGENSQRARCCELQPVRGWIDGCSPIYDINQHEHKCVATCWRRTAFLPFMFYAAEEVNCLGGLVDIAVEAQRQVERNTEWAVTTSLDHSPWEDNLSLRGQAFDMTPLDAAGAYTPVDVTQALAMFHHAYRYRAAGGFVLAAPAEALPFLVESRLVTNRGGVWRTATNVPVIVGSGFTGVAPVNDWEGNPKATPPSQTGPSSGVTTIYSLRSAPEYLVGPVADYASIFEQQGATEVSWRTNSEAAESVRQGVLRFDPFCIYGIQISLRGGSC